MKCILMPPQDLEKVGWFQSRKKQKVNECFDKKNHGLVNWWIDVTNKIMIYMKSSNTIENCTFKEKSFPNGLLLEQQGWKLCSSKSKCNKYT